MSIETYQFLLDKFKNDKRILQMKQYKQHGSGTTYDHVVHVAEMSGKIAKHFKIDELTLIRGIFLHDYFLYHISGKGMKHGFSHPKIALENALKDFELNHKEQNMIRSHMFPLTLFHIPTCKESWILTLSDKLCAIEERYKYFKDKLFITKFIRKFI